MNKPPEKLKRRSRDQDTADLKRNGYIQGDRDAQGTCEDCCKTANGNRGWWSKASYEYDEWDCHCRKCAIARIHQWDDFDARAFERTMLLSLDGMERNASI